MDFAGEPGTSVATCEKLRPQRNSDNRSKGNFIMMSQIELSGDPEVLDQILSPREVIQQA